MAQIVTKDGRRSDKSRKYQIQELRERHQEILRRALLGEKYVDIAAALSITPKNVSDVVNSDLGKEQLELMQTARNSGAVDITQDIAAVAPSSHKILKAAIDRTLEIVEKDLTYIPIGPIIKIAQDNLDRSGYGAVKRTEVRKTSLHFNAAEIDRINHLAQQEADRAIDVGRKSGVVSTEAEFEDVTEDKIREAI